MIYIHIYVQKLDTFVKNDWALKYMLKRCLRAVYAIFYFAQLEKNWAPWVVVKMRFLKAINGENTRFLF